jgi:2-keto-4-pentenoate hydratase/2-oxohepta-3-ene-1,7-dioic acid hydratase in catechol pathway
MKLARIGEAGGERPVAAISASEALDLSGVVGDLDAAAIGRLPEISAAVAGGGLPVVSLDGVRFGPPVARPGKIVCVGLNYAAHAAETNADVPAEPVLFMKAPDTVVGPHDDVRIPPASTATDYEVELAVVIGTTARHLADDADPLAYVAGYTISNDVSERHFQIERGGQWDKGKNCETFNPLGPFIVSADEIDPTDLALSTHVNGEQRQSDTTAHLICGVAELVRYISRFMTLYPGDVIDTGTPAGVAHGYPDPKPYLRHGDVVELAIAGLGTQRQTFVAAEAYISTSAAANGR